MNFRGTLTSLLIVLAIASNCYGHKFYQTKIPNGEMVPHPCKPNYLWRGVGHDNHLGSGPRNAFGEDFKSNGFVWDSTLCQKDSDGDGKTNGEELGDPECTWTEGTDPKRSAGLSHPGICDPFDSSRCSGKPEFIECDELEFKCDALHQQDTVNFTKRYPETPVPTRETTYYCMMFDFPDPDVERHIVALAPHIDTADVMHHILVYGCTGEVSRTRNVPYDCNMAADRNCNDIIGLWTVGISGHCLHKNTGFLIGGSNGYRTAALQVHWNNPLHSPNYMDSSGMTFFVTPKLRPYNAGVLMIGQDYLQLPPLKNAYGVVGKCDSDCTPEVLTDDINIVAGINHMHYLGAAQLTEVIRGGKVMSNIAMDNTYSYDFPIIYDHETPIVVHPGDELKTTCSFRTTSRTTTTFQGESTAEEMCYSFLVFYPKENANYGMCTSWKGLSSCERRARKTKDGCDFAKLSDMKDPYILGIYANVTNKCQATVCREECKEYIRELRKTSTCFTGQNFEYIRYTTYGNDYADALFANAMSCDVELALEEHTETSAANILTAFPVTAVIAMVLAVLNI